MSTYVIVPPRTRGHTADDPLAYLVVHVEEWLRVYTGEQTAYEFVSEHTTLNGAHNKRNELNGDPGRVEEPPPPERVEHPVHTEGVVQWLGEKAA